MRKTRILIIIFLILGTLIGCPWNKKDRDDESVIIGSSGQPPVQISGPWASVASGHYGAYQTLAIKSDNTLWGWGDNSSAQLGFLDMINRNTPSQVGTNSDWKQVSGSNQNSLALKNNGTLWFCGYKSPGIYLELSNIGTSSDWAKIEIGCQQRFAIKTNNTLWAWGFNGNGQLGLGSSGVVASPVMVGIESDWSIIVTDVVQSFAIKDNNTLWACGANNSYQLGLGDTLERRTFTQIGNASDWNFVDSGMEHSHAIKKTKTLWSWGENDSGQLGLGYSSDNVTAVIQVGTDLDWSTLQTGSMHTIALKNDGTCWTWGFNGDNRLGFESVISNTMFTSPAMLGTGNDWFSVTAGEAHSIGIKKNKTMWAWGNNSYGQLGLGDTLTRLSPEEIKN